MRLRFTEPLRPEDRHALKPAVGETVLYEGTEYIVHEVGLRYARVYLKSNPKAIYMAKFTDLQKVFPKSSNGEIPMNMNFTP